MSIDPTEERFAADGSASNESRLERLEMLAAEHEEELHRLRGMLGKIAAVALDAARLPGPADQDGVQLHQDTFLIRPE